jgi:hypothetical protein
MVNENELQQERGKKKLEYYVIYTMYYVLFIPIYFLIIFYIQCVCSY